MERRKKVKEEDKKSTSKVKKISKEKVTFKSYVRDFLLFVEKNIWKTKKLFPSLVICERLGIIYNRCLKTSFFVSSINIKQRG